MYPLTSYCWVKYFVSAILFVFTKNLGFCSQIVEDTKRYAPGDSIMLECDPAKMADNPSAKVGWAMERDSEALIYLGSQFRKENPRYVVDEDGVLIVKLIDFEDEGKYFCVAADKKVKYVYIIIVTDDEGELMETIDREKRGSMEREVDFRRKRRKKRKKRKNRRRQITRSDLDEAGQVETVNDEEKADKLEKRVVSTEHVGDEPEEEAKDEEKAKKRVVSKEHVGDEPEEEAKDEEEAKKRVVSKEHVGDEPEEEAKDEEEAKKRVVSKEHVGDEPEEEAKDEEEAKKRIVSKEHVGDEPEEEAKDEEEAKKRVVSKEHVGDEPDEEEGKKRVVSKEHVGDEPDEEEAKKRVVSKEQRTVFYDKADENVDETVSNAVESKKRSSRSKKGGKKRRGN